MNQAARKDLKFARVAAQVIGIVAVLSVALCSFGIVVPVATVGTLVELGPYWAASIALSLILPAWCFVTWGAIAIHYAATLLASPEPRWQYTPGVGRLWPRHHWVRSVCATAMPAPLHVELERSGDELGRQAA